MAAHKQKTVYFTDYDTDFVQTKKKHKVIDGSYKYIRTGFLYRVVSFILYRLIATPIAFIYNKLILGEKYVGTDKLRGKSGYMLYCNHTEMIADAFTPSLISFPSSVYTVVHPDNLAAPVVGGLTHMLGALPLPSDIRSRVNFNKAISVRLSEGRAVAVYPEGHLWQGCGFVREFKPGAFALSVRENTEVYAVTRTYKKRGRGYRCIVYIDGPFYSRQDISRGESEQLLSKEVYDIMCKRASLSDFSPVKYIKRDWEAKNE